MKIKKYSIIMLLTYASLSFGMEDGRSFWLKSYTPKYTIYTAQEEQVAELNTQELLWLMEEFTAFNPIKVENNKIHLPNGVTRDAFCYIHYYYRNPYCSIGNSTWNEVIQGKSFKEGMYETMQAIHLLKIKN